MNNKLKISSLMIALLSSTAMADNNPAHGAKEMPLKSHHELEGKHVNHHHAKKIHGHKHHGTMHKLKHHFKLEYIEIDVNGETLDKELKTIYEPYLGKNFTQKDLEKLYTDIIDLYIKAGYLLPRPYLLEHNMKEGRLRIQLKLDSINDVVIVGDGESDPLMKEYAAKLVNLEQTKIKDAQRYINLISKVPGFLTEYNLVETNPNEPNPEKNPMQLLLMTQKTRGTIHTRIDNFGTKEIGKYQASAFTQLYSPFGHDETLLLNLVGTDKLDRMKSVAFGYEQPINNEGTSLNFLASYTQSNPTKGLPVRAKDNVSNSFGGSVGHYLLLTSKSHLKVNLGVDHENYVGYSIPDDITSGKVSDLKLTKGKISLDYLIEDNMMGRNFLEIAYHRGLAGKFKYFTPVSQMADKNFGVVDVNFYREQELPNDLSVFAHLGFQSANKTLPDHEEFSVGGRDFGRGYKNSALSSDRGVGFSIEARYHYKMENSFLQEIEPYAYYDVAKILKKQPSTNDSVLASAGPGVRFKFSNEYMAGMEMAFPSKKTFVENGVNRKSVNNFTFFLSKTFRF